jgi:uncharacterized membrane protein YdbT with pleckstrin-like domain
MTGSYLNRLLADNEEILLSTRRFWFVLLKEILLDLILIIVLIAGSSILLTMVGPFAAIGYVLAVIPLIDLIRQLLDWINRQYLVTNRRVIQISGIVNKSVTDSSLEKVNDVKLTQSFWGRIFGYGDVEILTASELGTNLFQFLGDPVGFKKAMMDAKNRLSGDSEDSNLRFKNVIKERTIPDLISELDELRIKGIITQEEFLAKKKDLLSRM